MRSTADSPEALETGAGLVWPSVLPVPSWPNAFAPQQNAAPLDEKAHVCARPAATPTGDGTFPTPLTFEIRPRPDFPSPTSPESSLPQHQKSEPIVHACELPQARTLEFETPLTTTGDGDGEGTGPLPNCPDDPSPQQ